jgi:hypothetical protein
MLQKHESLNKLLSHIAQHGAQPAAGDPPQADAEHTRYQSWLDRGRPEGASETDWKKAENEFQKSAQAGS